VLDLAIGANAPGNHVKFHLKLVAP